VTARQCDSERPSLCLGTVAIPQLPSVLVGQESRALRIELGIRAPADLIIGMSGLGLQVIQGDDTNYDESITDFAKKLQSFGVKIYKDEMAADFTIVPHALGRHPVTYELAGAAADNFVALDDVEGVVYGLTCALLLCRSLNGRRGL
jgi:hypothetical protein